MEIARDLAPRGMELVIAPPGSPEFEAALPEAGFLVGFGSRAIDAGFYRRAPRLRLYQLLSAGYDTVDIAAARAAGIPVCNNGGANSTAVAEHAIMLMLAACRRLVWQHESVAAGRWRGNDLAGTRLFELRDKTLGIVGLGAIGRKVARLANAFGMRVQYYDIRRVSEAEEDALTVRFRLLGEILRTSDIVSLHVPLTPATRHMIGAAELAAMRPTAYLINTCRGPVVEEAALVAALAEGRIAGAGLDVFDQEPPAADHPLFRLKNVVLTPHFAGPTWDNQQARFRNAFDNCQRVARGEAPLWVIPELAG
ncbi:lactate dehydrogenase [Roseicella aquatilis]|uniref:Lactate dehydrogenase n=2 Tax=Roseicella aquatilis TaxID=2527868 RepID=A0A4R4DD10_9PROT|nr:lactate dehydrogenase [Roseicella aquatilis]